MLEHLRDIPVFLGEGENKKQMGVANVTKVNEAGCELEFTLAKTSVTILYTNPPWDVFAFKQE